jgi:hypothetical protein
MREIFVFGSNLAGRHGKGAALHALRKCGAIYGLGVGIQGDSYAIPTKDEFLHVLPLSSIEMHVQNFLIFAKFHYDMKFLLTPIGCGLAGYKHKQIAPFFKYASPNIIIPEEFKLYIGENNV